MRRARVATKIGEIVAKAVLAVAGAVAGGALTGTVLANTVFSQAANYRTINFPTSIQQTIEAPPSSSDFETGQLGCVRKIAMGAKVYARMAGVDSSAGVTEQDIKRLAEMALPYIARELNTKTVNAPNISFGKLLGEWGGL